MGEPVPDYYIGSLETGREVKMPTTGWFKERARLEKDKKAKAKAKKESVSPKTKKP